jgi:hypothetical protein
MPGGFFSSMLVDGVERFSERRQVLGKLQHFRRRNELHTGGLPKGLSSRTTAIVGTSELESSPPTQRVELNLVNLMTSANPLRR